MLKRLLFCPLLLAPFAGRTLQHSSLTTPPPIKMGLWESTITTRMMPTDVPESRAEHVIKLRQCLTPGSWTSSFRQGPGNSCTRSNESLSDHAYSADLACIRASTNVLGRIEMAFPSPDSAHGTIHLDVEARHVVNGQLIEYHLTNDSTLDMHFVSEDCGSVNPDAPQVVQ